VESEKENKIKTKKVMEVLGKIHVIMGNDFNIKGE